jgi:NAD(P)-dependent dehydrogenase (short-subunit alcohol dehydrogenase family)
MGEQAAHALSQQGARVLCVDLDPQRAARVAHELDGHAIAADVTRREEMQRVVSHATDLFGAGFSGLVDVVGMAFGRALTDMGDDDWRRQFDMVFTHAHLAIQYGAPALARNGGGSMVFVGSVAGLAPRSGRMLAYGASKAALNHLVGSAAQEWAPRGVRLNVVAPGLTRTPRLLDANGDAFWQAQAREIPLGRPAETADVASAILFFCCDLSSHVTGNVLPVDGGSHGLNQTSYTPALTPDVRRT